MTTNETQSHYCSAHKLTVWHPTCIHLYLSMLLFSTLSVIIIPKSIWAELVTEDEVKNSNPYFSVRHVFFLCLFFWLETFKDDWPCQIQKWLEKVQLSTFIIIIYFTLGFNSVMEGITIHPFSFPLIPIRVTGESQSVPGDSQLNHREQIDKTNQANLFSSWTGFVRTLPL